MGCMPILKSWQKLPTQQSWSQKLPRRVSYSDIARTILADRWGTRSLKSKGNKIKDYDGLKPKVNGQRKLFFSGHLLLSEEGS